MIVDEGHNLVDAVNAVHSAVIFRGQLATAKLALDTYFTRFSSRLAPGASTMILWCLNNDCAYWYHCHRTQSSCSESACLQYVQACIACSRASLYETREQWPQWLAGNSKHIQSLIALATVLHDCLEQDKSSTPAAAQILTVNNFLFSKGLDNLNLFRLIRHVPLGKDSAAHP